MMKKTNNINSINMILTNIILFVYIFIIFWFSDELFIYLWLFLFLPVLIIPIIYIYMLIKSIRLIKQEVNNYLNSIDVPSKYRLHYEESVVYYRNKDMHDELIIILNKKLNKLYIIEYFS